METYTMHLEWSNEDRVFVVSLPDFGQFAKTHGSTRAEAVKNGEEVLQMLIEHYRDLKRPLPIPQHFQLEVAA